jgi:hypothetical protein
MRGDSRSHSADGFGGDLLLSMYVVSLFATEAEVQDN